MKPSHAAPVVTFLLAMSPMMSCSLEGEKPQGDAPKGGGVAPSQGWYVEKDGTGRFYFSESTQRLVFGESSHQLLDKGVYDAVSADMMSWEYDGFSLRIRNDKKLHVLTNTGNQRVVELERSDFQGGLEKCIHRMSNCVDPGGRPAYTSDILTYSINEDGDVWFLTEGSSSPSLFSEVSTDGMRSVFTHRRDESFFECVLDYDNMSFHMIYEDYMIDYSDEYACDMTYSCIDL